MEISDEKRRVMMSGPDIEEILMKQGFIKGYSLVIELNYIVYLCV